MTVDPARRARRTLAAARAKHQPGAPEAALALLASAHAEPLDELQRARADVLRAEIAFTWNRGSDAHAPLLSAAKQLEPLDVTLACETYLEALGKRHNEGGHGARSSPPLCPPQGVVRADAEHPHLAQARADRGRRLEDVA